MIKEYNNKHTKNFSIDLGDDFLSGDFVAYCHR